MSAPGTTPPPKDPNDAPASASEAGGDLFVVKPVPGAGMGAVALRTIPRGTRILADAPLFVVPTNVTSVDTMKQIIALGLKSASKAQQREFLTLDNAHKQNGPLVGTASTNVHPMGGAGATEAGLFLTACRINHGCVPNAQNKWRADLGRMTVHAARDIAAGEEITLTYLPGIFKYADRQRILRDHFGFVCRCPACARDPADIAASDARRDEINRLDELLGDGKRIVDHAEESLHDVYRKLRLLREDGISDASISRTYHDAFQIAIANGDQARARVFAERDYDSTVSCEGADSPEARRVQELVKNPKSHPLYSGKMQWKQGLEKIPKDLGEAEFEEWLFRLPKGGLKP